MLRARAPSYRLLPIIIGAIMMITPIVAKGKTDPQRPRLEKVVITPIVAKGKTDPQRPRLEKVVITQVINAIHMRTQTGENIVLDAIARPPFLPRRWRPRGPTDYQGDSRGDSRADPYADSRGDSRGDSYADSRADSYAHSYLGQAKASLEQLVLNRAVYLDRVSPVSDRHNRQPVHLRTPDSVLVQRSMLVRGWAYVAPAPRDKTMIADLYAAEREARRKRLGMWQSDTLTPLDHTKAERRIGDFAVIDGTVMDVRRIGRHIYLNFAHDWRRDFTILIKAKKWPANCPPKVLQGHPVRVRGWVVSYYGAMIEAFHPGQIEPLASSGKPLAAHDCPLWQ